MSAICAADDRGNRFWLGGAGGGTLKHLMMANLLDRADLKEGSFVADLSAGTAAVALAQVARERGLKARVYVPDCCDAEVLKRLQDLQAIICPGPATAAGMAAALAELSRGHLERRWFWTRQNYNPDACAAYEAPGRQAGPASVLVAGLGSGGVLRGFGRALRPTKTIAIVSPDIPGLRPPGLVMDAEGLRDLGAPHRLDAELRTVSRQDVAPELRLLASLGVRAGPATAALWKVVRDEGLQDALMVSVDGARVRSSIERKS
ncbi:MAG: pyridoxal-phosphate dependent enzyme [Candidatus Xenobia bacterium]